MMPARHAALLLVIAILRSQVARPSARTHTHAHTPTYSCTQLCVLLWVAQLPALLHVGVHNPTC
jgi:hypothetical protein